MQKKYLILFIILLLLAGAVWFYWDHFKSPPKQIQTVTVQYGSIQQTATAIGSILPRHSVTVKSQLSGIVAEIFHSSGSYVHKGEELLRIRPNPTPSDYAKALTSVHEDQAKVIEDKMQLANYQYLLRHKIISKNYSKYLMTQMSFNIDKALLKDDLQNLELTERGEAVIGGQKMQGIITSPINGYILQKGVDVGDPVISLGDNQIATELFTIANMHELMFRGSVDQLDAGRLKKGMKAIITVAALPGIKIHGRLERLALQSDSLNNAENTNANSTAIQSNSPFNVGFQVQITNLQVPKHVVLRSGYSATASIIVKKEKHVLVLPVSCIVFKHGKSYVRLPNKHGKTKLQVVQVGLSDGMQVQIKQGVKLGERVQS